MTSGAFAAALGSTLLAAVRQASGDRVVTVTTSIGVGADAMPDRMARGDAVDVSCLPEAGLDDLIARGLIAAGTKVILARSAIGMAVRAGAPKPDISSVEALADHAPSGPVERLLGQRQRRGPASRPRTVPGGSALPMR